MRWTIKPKPSEENVKLLADQLNVDNLIATLLIQRGVETFEKARTFFRPSLDDLHNPYLMKDMDKAVARIEKAIANGENILVFGDYDVDGTTAVSLVSSYLKSYYPNVATYIPDRYDEGYGISFKGIDFADDNGFSLIIALDCGIKSIDHVAYANAKNIDFIICDHHRPGRDLPNAIAVLDPKRDDCSYPYDELCGCGIGFKLIQALGENRNQTIEDLILYLDLVATAIGADIVPITGENRILAKFGLDVINTNPRPGIKALIQNVKKKVLTITDVVFIVAPRINAAGRIKHGNEAVSLLTEYDIDQAEQFGGHMYAAGMTIKEENYLNFKNAFEKEVQATIPPELLLPEISVDSEIDFADISPKLIRILSQFEPFGPQNMSPVFLTKNVKDTGYAKPLGKDNEHLKLFVKQNGSEGFGAIGFNLGSKLELTKNQKPVEMVYHLDENEFNGTVTVQLRIKDFR